LGLIGGMSWESTALYYRELNQEVTRRLGGQHSSKILLHSVDFAPVVRRQHAGEWDRLAEELSDVAARLEGAGADAIVLCTSTMHAVAAEVQSAVSVPLVHIADAVGEAALDGGHRVVGLLGTRFTMEQPFYRDRLRSRFAIETRVPDEADREAVHRILYDELCRGIVRDASHERYREVASALVASGASAIVLGCTETGTLLPQDALSVPMLDSLRLHCRAAVDLQLTGTRPRTRTSRSE
jgi:aspartate racemase